MKKLIIILFISIVGFKTYSQGNLAVHPTRVTFEDNKRKQILDLINQGKDTTSYTLAFLHYKMTEDGKLELVEAEDSLNRFADKYLRFFPRKVRLAPKEKQTISLQYTKQPTMKPGEYRSHVYFKEDVDTKPLVADTKANDTSVASSEQMSVKLKAVVSISIPVVIQTGEINVKAWLSDLKLFEAKDTIQEFKFTLHREGNASVYGDFILEFTPEKGKKSEVASSKGIGAYVNINQRFMTMRIKIEKDKPLKKGKFKLIYRTKDENNPVLLAESELVIN